MFHTRRQLAILIASAALAFGASDALAQRTAAASMPPGTYAIDTNHMAVVARVPHNGFSYEIFRFGAATGELIWDPLAPANNRLTATLPISSLQTAVPNFAQELSGEHFLNAAQFPTATFTSTAFRQVDATHAQVDGDLVLKGVTRRVTFNVELVGAGQNQRGASIIGVHATTTVNNADYSFPSFITGQSEIVIDGEFVKR